MECEKNKEDNQNFTKIKEKSMEKEESLGTITYLGTIAYPPSQRPLFVIDTTGDSNLLKTKEEILKDTMEKFNNVYCKKK